MLGIKDIHKLKKNCTLGFGVRLNEIYNYISLTLFSDRFRCPVDVTTNDGDGGQDEGGESHSLIGSSFIIIIGELLSRSRCCPSDNFNEIAG